MADVLLKARQIRKRFGGVEALKGVSLNVHAGRVLGLAGDNGAGKSTLMKIIGGAEWPDSGQLLIDGNRSYSGNPKAAQREGVQVVYQDLALCGNVSAVSNIFLGREKVRWKSLGPVSLLDQRAMREESRATITDLGLVSSEDLDVPARNLSGGQQQIVAIARAIFKDCRVLLLDEPTAALGVTEREHVLRTVRELAERKNIGIVIVSHNIDELVSIADHIVVLRHGRVVGRFDGARSSVSEVVSAIVSGSPLEENAAALDGQ